MPETPVEPAPTNGHFVETGSIRIPGRGLALAWSPDGTRIAAGGRFRDKPAGLRYDTRIADVATLSLQKSFACHYFYVVATAWTANPFLGDLIADGGGDHAVKLWDANGPGSIKCKPGQLLAADGGVKQLGEINGWITGLAFSPDGRFLAGSSRDRMVRIWQMEPGPHQFKVVGVIYDKEAGNAASVAWLPDGSLVTSDRKGHVTAWDYRPDVDGFDDATIEDFANVSYEGQPGWCLKRLALTTPPVRWRDTRRNWIWNVRVSPDGTRVAAAGNDGILVVYDAATGDDVFRKVVAEGSELHGLDWSPDGALLAVGAKNKSIYVVDAATGEHYDRLAGHGDLVSAVAWSPDGTTLASTAGGARVSMSLLDVATGPDQTIRLWQRN